MELEDKLNQTTVLEFIGPEAQSPLDGQLSSRSNRQARMSLAIAAKSP